MEIPPHVKRLLPTLTIDSGQIDDMEVTLTMRELSVLIDALASAEIDEDWYLQQYSDVRDAVAKGALQSATQHYRRLGFFEGRLPSDPAVDEEWYRTKNPDVSAGIRQGKFRSAKDHYIQCGYSEGRAPQPTADDSAGRAPAPNRFAPRMRV